MDSSDLGRDVELLCPTCGASQFEKEEGVDGEVVRVTCAGCEREFTMEELIEGNSENIAQHKAEIGEEAAEKAAEELKKTLEEAFKGNKNISIE